MLCDAFWEAAEHPAPAMTPNSIAVGNVFMALRRGFSTAGLTRMLWEMCARR